MSAASRTSWPSPSEPWLGTVQDVVQRHLHVVEDGDCFTPGYHPFPHQQRFHDAEARYVLFGGAAGPGKSAALLQDAIAFCRQHPGVNAYLLRRTYPELEDTLIAEFLKHCPTEWATYNFQSHTAVFGNSSRLRFRHCNHANVPYRYKSTNIDWLGIDELTEMPFAWWQYLCSRLRASRAGVSPRFRASTNPGGVGHHAVKSLWVDRDAEFAAEPEVHFDLRDFEFIPARVTDNAWIMEHDPDYVRRLESLPETERKALLHGDWNVFAGQYFTEWLEAAHVVEPFEVPVGWPRWTSTDDGETNPWCTLWLTLDPATGIVYVYREHYAAKQRLEWHVEEVRTQSEGEVYRLQVADPAMWGSANRSEGSRAEQAERLGLGPLTAGNNNRIAGWTLVKGGLHRSPDGPTLQVFRTCRNLIRTLPGLIHDKQRPEDLDTTGEDHAADALRLGLMAIWGTNAGAAPVVGRGPSRGQRLAQSKWRT